MTKKIINGNPYDIGTATCIGSYHNGLSRSDSRHCNEELYRKPTGEYFLSGKGGSLSKYATLLLEGWTYGSAIIPLTLSEAKEWAERNMSAEDYIDEFEEVEV